MLKATDKEVQDILFGQAAADETKLRTDTARLGRGHRDSDLDLLQGPITLITSGRGSATRPAPDPAVH